MKKGYRKTSLVQRIVDAYEHREREDSEEEG